jgi:hypothetical protein
MVHCFAGTAGGAGAVSAGPFGGVVGMGVVGVGAVAPGVGGGADVVGLGAGVVVGAPPAGCSGV